MTTKSAAKILSSIVDFLSEERKHIKNRRAKTTEHELLFQYDKTDEVYLDALDRLNRLKLELATPEEVLERFKYAAHHMLANRAREVSSTSTSWSSNQARLFAVSALGNLNAAIITASDNR